MEIGKEDRPDEISFPRDILEQGPDEKVFVDVKAKIIYDSAPGDIINQFITFARVFDRQVALHGKTREAVDEVLRICRDQNVLRDYLLNEEAANIMFTLLDELKAKRFMEEELRQEGRQEGRKEGLQEGLQEGRQEGRKEGRQEGLEEGRLNMLKDLVKDNMISFKDAVIRSGKTDEDFSRLTGIPIPER